MKLKYSRLLFGFFVVAVVAAASIAPSQAQVAWIQQSIYGFQVKNNTSSTANQFQLKLKGVSMWALDQGQCLSNTYNQCSVTEDWHQNELTITWSQGSTAAGGTAQFSVVINHYVSLQGCDMIWADANGAALGHIDCLWQNWITSGSCVYGMIPNRTAATRYVRRAVGYSSNPTSLTELSTMTFPPNMMVLEPTGTTAIEPNAAPATFDYTPYYLANRSNFMFYEVYADSAATSPIISFKTAAVTTIPAGGISFLQNVDIKTRAISSPTDVPYEMISARAIADPYEDLRLDWIVINSDGESGSPADITVKIWNDVDNDGKVTANVDQLLGSSVLSAGSDQATVQMTPSVNITKGTEIKLVVTCNLPSSVPVGSVFSVTLSDASATGLTTNIRVPKTGDSIDGGSIMVTPPATTIGSAKNLPLDPTTGKTSIVWLKDMRVTAFFGDIVYIEDKDRISGIGVDVGGDDHPDFEEGMKVSVMGRICLDYDGFEAILEPINGITGEILTPLTPLMMTNKSAGGGAYGIQPAVTDNAYDDILAGGLNNVGKLIKIYGQVTGTETFADEDETINIAWIDDGSGLQDGVADHSGVAIFMPSDWNGTPLSGTVAVTGIIRSQASPEGRAIRVLFPRSMSDIQ